MPQSAARRAFDLAMIRDWQQFAQELVIPRARFIELNQRFEPNVNAEEAYAKMLETLRQGFDKIAAGAGEFLDVGASASRVKNGLEISKVPVAWQTGEGERHVGTFTMIALDDRRYVVGLD